MLTDLTATNAKAADMVLDPSPHVAAICPRRAGKTYAAVLAALITGEAKPGSISLIISLNKKQLKRLYWQGAPSGLHTLARKYGLNLLFNGTDLRWEHENGSFGYLLGADDDEQLEVIRGLEADLYIVDECKSFVPATLQKLIDDIIDPQRNSRKGRLLLIGTPGFINSGPFWRATCPTAQDSDGRPFLVGIDAQYRTTERRDPWGRTPDSDLLWSCHHWTLQDNTALPHQWESALVKKRAMRWADEDPSWCREYLGMWSTGASNGLVYRYAAVKQTGTVTWHPERTDDNPSGLPPEGAPWRFIGGLDIGYEAPTAFVVAAYSRKLGELRHVIDFSMVHMLPPDIAAMILAAIDKYGPIEKIYCDVGNLGKMVVQSLIRDYGLPLEKADKREKMDYIELLNAGFVRGEVKIIENTVLEMQLLSDAWKLPDERAGTIEQMARSGKLVEDKSIHNDSTDAFLYMYRGSLHHFGVSQIKTDDDYVGSPAWVARLEKTELARARAEFADKTDRRLGDNRMSRAPSGIRRALDRSRWKLPSRPSTN